MRDAILNLRNWMAEQGIDAPIMAKRLGISHSHFWRIINEKECPKLGLQLAIWVLTGGRVSCPQWLKPSEREYLSALIADLEQDDWPAPKRSIQAIRKQIGLAA